MTANYQTGYRTVTTVETAALDSASVRVVQHIEDGINSTAVAMSPKLVGEHYPDLATEESQSGVERVLRVWPPFYAPLWYDRITATIGAYRDAGTGSVVLKLYASTELYNGSKTYDSTVLSDADSVTVATVSSGAHDIFVSKRTLLRKTDAATWQTWLALTATASDATTIAKVTTVDISAQGSVAY